MQKFGNLTTASSGSDNDKDGASDFSEYLAGTDPGDSNSYLKIVSQSYNAGITEVTIEFTSSPTRLYRIEYSTDLGITDTWDNSPLSTFSPDAGFTTTRTFTFGMITSSQYFFRAIAVSPLSL